MEHYAFGKIMEYFKQEKDYTCGCACVKMALSMFEPEFIEEELLEKELDTKPNRGTDPKNVEKIFIDRNYDVVSKEHSSVEEIQKYFEEGWAVFLAPNLVFAVKEESPLPFMVNKSSPVTFCLILTA